MATIEMTAEPVPRTVRSGQLPERFDFSRDTFAFPNELLWEYNFDSATGKTTIVKRNPKPDYALRCFVLTRAVRQFFYHAKFDPSLPVADDALYRRLIREVIWRNTRERCVPECAVMFPGFGCLRDFSREHGELLKSECGGAWRSYVLRSHWRMIFPISRAHQQNTAAQLLNAIAANRPPIIHLVLFPRLTINHGMVLYDATEAAAEIQFQAYDPNMPEKPTTLTFDRATRTFLLPANPYWVGGVLDVIEIYRNWFF
jgi:hypothetical protein